MNNDFINFPENYANLDDKGKRLEALVNLSQVLLDREKRIPITFNDFLYLTLKSPQYVLRDIFQLFFDMIHYYIPEGVEDYPERGESVGYVRYDAENLFVRGCDDPFFADRLFINRFMNMIESFKQGSLNNHIFLFEGPPGSGKSTFLNNILLKLEEYTRTNDGAFFKTYWNIDVERLGGYKEMVKHLQSVNLKIDEELGFENHKRRDEDYEKKHLQFSCPRHDHPILHIPKSYRKQFLDELIPDEKFKEDLFFKNEYEWVLKEVPCNICQSLFSSLLEILSDPLEVFSMIFVRKMHFNRQFGEGISVYNPGDKLFEKPIENASLEKMLHNILKNDSLQFIYSDLAKTNNGVLALMDIKEDNIERLKGLHGIISDGVHKVELVEERIKSLFVGLVNPEDKIHYEGIKSFQDRIITVNIPYILDYNTEVAIYKNKFGKNIESRFLPGVLENFAKIIISSRMDIDTPVIKKWLGSIDKYSKYLDKYALLLKMEIYTGKIPDYLSEEDLKKFNRHI